MNSSNNVTVTVNSKPTVPTVSISGNTDFCQGVNLVLSVINNSAFTYQWKNNENNISGATANSYTATNSGKYKLIISNAEGCTNQTQEVTVNVSETPSAPLISTSGATSFCQGDSVILTVTNNADYAYQWKLNGGAVGVNSNQYTAKNQGTYSLEVTNSKGCKAISANVVSTLINPLPNISAISLSGSTDFCEGDSLTMGVAFTAGYSYQWRNELGPIIGGTTNKFAAKATGRYYSDIFDEKGCKISSPPVNVNLRINPPVPVVITDNFHPELCNIESPIVLRVKDPAETYSYQWKRNGYPFNNNNQSYLEGYLPQGDYTVVANSGGCMKESLTTPIYFENAPKKPLLYAHGPIVWYLACSNDSASTYKWYYNGNLIQGADKYIYIANHNLGSYYVTISNSTGCFTPSDIVTIPTGVTGIDDIDPYEGLKIYPNPTTGMFTIEMDNEIFGELLIRIITEQGKDILSLKFKKKTEHFSDQINLSDQIKGIYFINLTTGKYFTTRKLVIE